MTKEIFKSLFLALVVLGLLGSVAVGKSEEKKGATKGLKKTATDDAYAYIDINQVLRWISNNGDGSFDPNTGVAGNYWPKGTSNTCVYEDGLVYGGYVTGGGVTNELRLTGSTYRHAFQAGQIVKDGSGNPVADDPTKEIYRIFKIQKNFHSFAASDPKLYAQMKKDYLEWPGDMGAPYVDKNGDGAFQAPVLDADDNLVSGDAPQFLGDQVLFHVSNDMNAGKSRFVYGSQGLGIEIQRTVWGYALTGSIGNSWFERYRLINKGGLRIDSMRIGLWADVDLGGGAKDLNGCDTSIQLGYIWNGGDAAAGGPYAVPIADGYVVLQGPMVPGAATDSADFNFRKVPGYKNLRMAAYTYYINGSSVLRDPEFNLNGTLQFYRYLKGLVWDGTPFIDPTTNQPTPFCLWGDPVAKTGWYDGSQYVPSDRRQLIGIGPFTMMPGDTQEVIQAYNVSMGADKYGSVSLLKEAARVMKVAYDLKFNLPTAPPAPNIKTTGLVDKIVLDWSDPVASKQTESASNTILGTTWAFQGYDIYQLPSPTATKAEGKRLATYDIKDGVTIIANPTFDATTGLTVDQASQFGTDVGIQRYFVVDHDYLTGSPLVKGRKYYFAVTAYSYNATPPFGTKDLENTIGGSTLVTVIPQDPAPGNEYFGTPLSTAPLSLLTGSSTSDVTAVIVDPSKLTGSDYKVVFHSAGTDSVIYSGYAGSPLDTLLLPNVNKFSVVRVTTGDTVVKRNSFIGSNVYPWTPSTEAPVADGIQWKVSGLPQYQQYNEVRGITYAPSGNFNLGSLATGGPAGGLGMSDAWTGVITAASWSGQLLTGADGQGLPSWKVTQTIEIRFADPANASHTGWSKGYGYLKVPSRTQPPSHTDPTTAKVKSNNWWYSTTSFGGYKYTGYWDSPLTVWDVTDTTNPKQLSWAYTERDQINGPVSTKIFTAGIDPVTGRPDTLSFFRDWRGNVAAPGQAAGDSLTVARYMNVFHPGDTLVYRPIVPNYDTTNPSANKRWFKIQASPQNFYTDGVIIVINEPYTTTPKALYQRAYRNALFDVLAQSDADLYNGTFDALGAGKMPASYAVMLYYKSAAKPAATPGDVLRIIPNRPLSTASVYHFSTANMPKGAIIGDPNLAKSAVGKINVFPNPYFGLNSQEVNKYQRFVTFSHLPSQATIRIFNLAGVHVTTIVKNDNTNFAQWDLRNANGLPVASGMYLAYIDLGASGTKILKLAVIMEAQFLDRL